MTKRVTRGFDPARLKHAREDHPNPGLRTRGELARLAGVGVATIQQWENGDKSPQVDLLFKVATVLGVPMEYLVVVPEAERSPADLRVLRGLTQPQLGARAQVSTAMIGRIERGQVALTEETADKLAGALGLAAEVLRAAYERVRNRDIGAPA